MLPSSQCSKNQQYDSKWYIPLTELTFQDPEEAEPLTIPQIPDEELDAMKVKISHLRSEIQREKVAWKICSGTKKEKSGFDIDVFTSVISERQQGFKGHRPAQEEALWTGVPAPVNVSELAHQGLQQERQGDDTLRPRRPPPAAPQMLSFSIFHLFFSFSCIVGVLRFIPMKHYIP